MSHEEALNRVEAPGMISFDISKTKAEVVES